MGVPTIAESQLQRPSGSGVASATGYRTQVRPAKTPRHPPIVLSTLGEGGSRVFQAAATGALGSRTAPVARGLKSLSAL